MQRRFALIGHGHSLSDITDFSITGVADNNLLQYDSALALWTNRTYLALNEITDPGYATANEAWVHAEDVAGYTVVHHNVSDAKWAITQDSYIVARNTSGGAVTKGQAVYVTGSTGARPEIAPADADLHHHAIGLVVDAIANNGYTRIQTGGLLTGVDTSAWTAGSQLWLSSTAGALTSTEPVHPASEQALAVVIYQHAVNGILYVNHHEDMREVDGSHYDSFTIGSSLTDRAVLDITGSALTASRTFKFPDAAGTFGILERVNQTFTGRNIFADSIESQNGYLLISRSSAANMFLEFYNSSAAANDKTWDFGLSTDFLTMNWSAYTDASVEHRVIGATRTTGTGAIASIAYGNSTDEPTHTFYGTLAAYDGSDQTMAMVVNDYSYTYAYLYSSYYPEIGVAKYGADVFGGGIGVYHARGTKASPTKLLSGDHTGEIFFGAKKTTGDIFPAWIRYYLTADADTTAVGYLGFGVYDTTTPSTSEVRLALHTTGKVALGTDGWLDFDEHSSAPGSPSAGRVALYAKADGHLYQKDDAGTETDLTSGATQTRSFGASWGSSSALVAADCADVIVHVPQSGTINGVYVYTQGGSGSCVIDIWKDTYANFPPTVADTITAAAKPTISAATKYSDTTLTGWTTAVTAGDVIKFHVDSTSTFTNINVVVTYV